MLNYVLVATEVMDFLGKEMTNFREIKSNRIIYFIIPQTAVSKLKYGKIQLVCVRLHISNPVQVQQI